MSPPLYNREILALAVDLGQFPRLAAPDQSGELRAPLCGSRILMDLMLNDESRVTAIGMAAEACALGQAAATLLARHSAGQDGSSLASVHSALAEWLAGRSDTPPDWPGIDVLAPARDYPARHAAILLPFALAAALTTPTAQVAAA